MLAGVRAIMAAARGESLPLPARQPRPGLPHWFGLVFFLLLLAMPWWLPAVLGASLGSGTGLRGPYRRGPWGGGFGGGGGFRGGGGFGGGGFSGGGGGFGGGGASGRW